MTEDWVERQIRRLQQAGELEDLPAQGRPFSDLDLPYDPDWWVKRKLRDEGFVDLPPALAIRRRLERFLQSLSGLESAGEVARAVAELNREIGRVNATAIRGPDTSVALLDPQQVVELWRLRRQQVEPPSR